MGYSRIPTDQELERDLDHIKQEKSSALREKQNLQKQQKQFAVVQQNMDALFSTHLPDPKIQEPLHIGAAQPIR